MPSVISSLTALLIALSIGNIDSFTAIPTCNNLSKSTSVTSSRLMARKKVEVNDTAPAINPAMKAALDGVLQRIERNYGRGSIVKLGK